MQLNQWREQGQFFEVALNSGSYQIFYNHIDNQHDKTIVFMHGFPSSSHDYSLLVPELSKHYNLLFIDFLGFGFSDKPVKHDYSLFEQADIVEALIGSLKLKDFYWVSHDMGNSVTLELLKRNSLSIKKLALLNGSVLLKYYQPILSQRVLLNPIGGPILNKLLSMFAAPIFKQQFGSVFALKPSADEMEDFWQAVNDNNGFRIYYRLIRYLRERMVHENEWFAALAASEIPLAVIWGQLDPVSVPKIAEAICQARSDAQYTSLESIGHYPQWEDPQSVCHAIVQHFG